MKYIQVSFPQKGLLQAIVLNSIKDAMAQYDDDIGYAWLWPFWKRNPTITVLRPFSKMTFLDPKNAFTIFSILQESTTTEKKALNCINEIKDAFPFYQFLDYLNKGHAGLAPEEIKDVVDALASHPDVSALTRTINILLANGLTNYKTLSAMLPYLTHGQPNLIPNILNSLHDKFILLLKDTNDTNGEYKKMVDAISLLTYNAQEQLNRLLKNQTPSKFLRLVDFQHIIKCVKEHSNMHLLDDEYVDKTIRALKNAKNPQKFLEDLVNLSSIIQIQSDTRIFCSRRYYFNLVIEHSNMSFLCDILKNLKDKLITQINMRILLKLNSNELLVFAKLCPLLELNQENFDIFMKTSKMFGNFSNEFNQLTFTLNRPAVAELMSNLKFSSDAITDYSVLSIFTSTLLQIEENYKNQCHFNYQNNKSESTNYGNQGRNTYTQFAPPPTDVPTSEDYAQLGVTKTATLDEVRKAYKKKALQVHPDKHKLDKENANQNFKKLNAAHEKIVRYLENNNNKASTNDDDEIKTQPDQYRRSSYS